MAEANNNTKLPLSSITINNKSYQVTSATKYQVQVGKDKSHYENVYVFIGQPWQACGYYRGINIGKGYKKRLLVDGKVAARCES
jgi:hypothetical protein